MQDRTIEGVDEEIKGSESFSSVFHSGSSSVFSDLPQNQVNLSYPDQVEATSKSIQAKINVDVLKELLKWVTEGHLEEVKKLLEWNPSLGLGTGNVEDRSKRTFKNITVLQYAAWALDAEMVELIMKYVGAHDSAVQLKALEMAPERYSEHGLAYDYKELVNKYQMYIDNYDNWDANKRVLYWQKEIGGEQRKCPAWLIYAWNEKGFDVAWTKQDGNQKVRRAYADRFLDWWFTDIWNNGRGVGSSWAGYRGGMGGMGSALKFDLRNQQFGTVKNLLEDQKSVSNIVATRLETVERLKNEVERSLGGNMPVLGIRQ